jgi:putative glycerol-1-phosphate prenyltransferase
MPLSPILQQIYQNKAQGKKGFAVLIDPDKVGGERIPALVAHAVRCEVDYFLVGGSLLTNRNIHEFVPELKRRSDIPVILFPGSIYQIVPSADGLLFLSVISGRNPDLLIGNHVVAAPILRQTDIEILATGYILIDSGKTTSVHYMSNTLPIPYDKSDIAACTAMAGEMLGLRLIYMDAGSGADKAVSSETIHAVATNVQIPLIVGGGIRSAEEAERIWNAGADIIVIGNAIESDANGELMEEIALSKAARVGL